LLADGDYASSDASVAGGVRVSAAAARVAFIRPAVAHYGSPIGAGALDAVSKQPGAFSYTAAPVTNGRDARPVTAKSVLAAGEYDLQAHFTPAGGSPAEIVTVLYVVDPAPLVIRPDSKYMARGQLTPQLTWVAARFVNGDDPSSLLQSPLCVIATGPLTVGKHKIWCQGGYSPNYTISYPSTATLTVLRHPCPIGSYCATDPPLTAAQRRNKKILELICHPAIPESKTTLIRSVRRDHNRVRDTTWRGRIT
jgi:MBG domain (YGX type)